VFLAAAAPIWHRSQEEAEVGRHGHRSGDFLVASWLVFQEQMGSEKGVYPQNDMFFMRK